MDPITKVRSLGRRYFDGLLDSSELRELEALLQSDPDAADAFARLSRLEGDLSELFVREHDIRKHSDVLDTIDRHERRSRWLGRTAWGAVAASLLLVALGSLWWLLPRPNENASANEAAVVSGEVRYAEGVARVTSDEAVVRWGDGTQMRLERDSEYVLFDEDHRRVQLRQGVGRFSVVTGQSPFWVTTPVGVVTVLGTEFTITVISEEVEEEEPMKLSQVVMSVMVLSGLVGVESGPERVRLGVGESRVFAQEREGGERKDGERKEGERQPAVRGQRAAVVSVGDNKITVLVAGDEGRIEKTFDVSKDTKVLIDGKPGKLSGLTKGMVVILQHGRRDGGGLLGITAQGPTFEAKVKSVGKDKITIEGRGRESDPVEYPVSKETKVTIQGKAGKLDDLKAGDQIGLGLSADRKTVVAVVKGRGAREGGEKGREADRGKGVAAKIKAIDAKAGTITLTMRGDRELDLSLARDTKVTIDGKAGKLEDVKEGTVGTFEVDRESKTVKSITIGTGGDREGGERRARNAGGEVKSIDLEAKTIAVVGGREVEGGTFSLSKDVKLTANNVKVRDLKDLVAGMRVLLVLDREGKTVTEIIVSGPRDGEGEKGKGRVGRVVGRVKGAEKSDSTITLFGDREKPEDRLFPVAKDAKITIDGKPAKLEDIVEDMNAILILDSDKKTVKEITIVPARKGREKE